MASTIPKKESQLIHGTSRMRKGMARGGDEAKASPLAAAKQTG